MKREVIAVAGCDRNPVERVSRIEDVEPRTSAQDLRPDDSLESLFLSTLPASADDFARSRFAEGQRTLDLLQRHFPALFRQGRPRFLDLGSGNGGMLFPFAGSTRGLAVDTYVDADLRRFGKASGLSIDHVLASAPALPLRAASVDVVLMAEVLEHLAEPRSAAHEVTRILRPGGVCLISTPPRLKFMAKRDPHFGIPFLVALPDRLQRSAARATGRDRCYVHHIYATTFGIHRLFPPGACTMHVISHRQGWTKHLSWNYIAFQKRDAL